MALGHGSITLMKKYALYLKSYICHCFIQMSNSLLTRQFMHFMR